METGCTENCSLSFKRIKVISIGSSSCGKSCLIKRYCEERFVSKYIPTIGVDYGVKPITINDANIRVNFWDFSGAPEYLEIRNEFYKDTHGCLLVYDVSSRASFNELSSWLAEAAKHMDQSEGILERKITLFLCANKCDKQEQRYVTEQEGREFANSRGMQYFETSALSGQCVADMFLTLFKAVVVNQLE